MGEGSLYFAWYYALSTLLFLVITIISFSLLSISTSTCGSTCPLTLSDYGDVLYSACLCNVSVPGSGFTVLNSQGYITGQTQDPAARYSMISATVFGTSTPGENAQMVVNCYICSGNAGDDNVYQACPSYSGSGCVTAGLEGFQPATPFINQSTMCDTQTKTAKADILVGPSISLRSFVTATLYAIAVFYLLMTLGAFICAIGYNEFKSMYGSDWAKLTRCQKWLGVCCKVFPVITRIANLFVLFFILLAVISMFSYDVCYSATNSYGERVFYPEVSGFIAFVSVSWLFTCVGGSIFQKVVPRDTSFYNPPFPLDADAGDCEKCCSRTCFFFAHYGP